MADTMRFAVLGDPVGHSLSPRIHSAALQACGIAGEYRAITANKIQLRRAIDELRLGELDGFNVTMPLKVDAANLADQLTVEAQAGGSVNAMRVGELGVEGHSTDVVAFDTLLSDRRLGDLSSVLILGAGGSALAALAATTRFPVYLSARRPEMAERLADDWDHAQMITFGSPVAGALIINATPLGMEGESLPARLVEVASGLIDLPYGSSETPSISRAKDLGIGHVDGIEFLVQQAVETFEWWTGSRPPHDPLLVAARKG